MIEENKKGRWDLIVIVILIGIFDLKNIVF